MGTSSFLLFKTGESISAKELLSSIHKVCVQENLFFDSDEDTYNNEGILKYARVYISDMPFRENYSRTLCFSVYDEPYEYQVVSFEWDEVGNEYFKAIVSDDFYDNEDLLLQLSRAMLKIYPNSKIWIEEEWFYTSDNIENISDMSRNDWCYKNPEIEN
ncbi:hypothetical protein ASD24_25225 [Paenibacillus sp. Root52]|uniref:Uncharacterized protein n=1 Tax=Paenibacillus amylolyticus TaxID=1451 RepID=A0AAP5H3M0_PAEAM|nr:MULTISPECIES: hypothetical protein [Paenibacillus]KQY90205.1 hypothetical protein ASD24_25225 [Paenibacillus sp. Root52]MDR6725694.1 hypothetical protein [Paenibacillus amylolyticus]